MSHSETHKHEHKPFSAKLFIMIIATSLGLYLTALKFIAPQTWDAQWLVSLTLHINTFLMCHLSYAIFEFFFHRYVLHCPLIPGLSSYYEAHSGHHRNTDVVYHKGGVRNRYPILEEKQHENSFFPWYSYGAFVLILMLVFIPVYLKWPQLPIFLQGAFALAFSISLYELLHSLEHRSYYDWWLPRIEHQNLFVRKFWRLLYGFHLRHHADIKCNEGISGFFGIPIADLLFGTWVNPKTMYEPGRYVNKEEFEPPIPVFFIRWLDILAERRLAQYTRRKIARQKKKVEEAEARRIAGAKDVF